MIIINHCSNMPRGYPQLTKEQKREIINRIKEKGEKVSNLSKEYGVVPKTIYNLLRKTAQGTGALLELAKLKRENEALLKIIGLFTVQDKLGKKSVMAAAINRLAPPKNKIELAGRLGVSRSALYYEPILPAKDLMLKAAIEKVMSDHKAYGHRRIAWELEINKKRAKRVMKLFGLKTKRKRKMPKKPKDLNQAPA